MKALIISADNFEDTELLYPFYRLIEEGFEVDIASIYKKPIKGKHGYEISVNLSIEEVNPDNYVLLILPGGKAPSVLRSNSKVLEITKAFHQKGKIIGAICHGPQILISAGILKNRKATSYKSVAKELIQSEVNYEDKEVVVDENFITSRHPADLPYFMKEIFKKLKETLR